MDTENPMDSTDTWWIVLAENHTRKYSSYEFKRYTNRKQAENTAKACAKKFEEKFYVMGMISTHIPNG